MRAQRRQVDAARWPIVALDAGVGPSLQGDAGPRNVAQSVEQQYKDFTWTELSAVFFGNLTVIQPLYTFGKIAQRGEAADHGLRAREAQTRMQSADVAFEVAQMYEGMLYARDAGRFFEEMKDWLEKMLQQTQEMVAKKAATSTSATCCASRPAMGMADLGINEAQAGEAEARAGAGRLPRATPRATSSSPPRTSSRPVGPIPGDLDQLVRAGAREAARARRAARGRAWPSRRSPAPRPRVSCRTPGHGDPLRRVHAGPRLDRDPLRGGSPEPLRARRCWSGCAGSCRATMAPARAAEQRAQASVLRHHGRVGGGRHPGRSAQAPTRTSGGPRRTSTAEPGGQQGEGVDGQASADYSVGFLDVREVSDAVSSYVTLRTAHHRRRASNTTSRWRRCRRPTATLDRNGEIYPGQHARGAP